MCYEDQIDYQSETDVRYHERLKGKCKEGINVLGMVTLSDADMLIEEGKSGRGWIACEHLTVYSCFYLIIGAIGTTDAIFLEKPSYYDLVIDLTTSTPFKATRPTLYTSRPLEQQPGSRGPSHRLSAMRWTWSDVKLVCSTTRL